MFIRRYKDKAKGEPAPTNCFKIWKTFFDSNTQISEKFQTF